VLRLFATAAAFWVAAQIIPGINHTGSVFALIGVALVFGVVNALIAPFVKLLALPFIVLTLGLFALVVNALMLLLTSWLAGALNIGFTVSGFWSALFGSIVISIVSALVMLTFDRPDPRVRI
jgi:putative membrane protein